MASVSVLGATKDWVSIVNFGDENAHLDGWKIGEFQFSSVLLPPGAVSRIDQVKDGLEGVQLIDGRGNHIDRIPLTKVTHNAPVVYGLDEGLAVEEEEIDDIPHAGVGILCAFGKVITIANFSDNFVSLEGWTLDGYELEGEIHPGEAERFEIEPVDTERGLFLELIDNNDEIVDTVLYAESPNKVPVVFDLNHRIAARELLKVAEQLESQEHEAGDLEPRSNETDSLNTRQSDRVDEDRENPVIEDEFDATVGVDKVVEDRDMRESPFEDAGSDRGNENSGLRRAGTAKMGSLNYSNADMSKTINESRKEDSNESENAGTKVEKEDQVPVSSGLPPTRKIGVDASSWITVRNRNADVSNSGNDRKEYSRSTAIFNDSWITSTNATPINEEKNISQSTFKRIAPTNAPAAKDSWIATTQAVPIPEAVGDNDETFASSESEGNMAESTSNMQKRNHLQDSWIHSTAAVPVSEEPDGNTNTVTNNEIGRNRVEDSWIGSTAAIPVSEERDGNASTFNHNESKKNRMEDSWIGSSAAVPVSEEPDGNAQTFTQNESKRNGVEDSWINSTAAIPVSDERDDNTNTFTQNESRRNHVDDSWIGSGSAVPVSEESGVNESTFVSNQLRKKSVEDSWIVSTSATPIAEESAFNGRDVGSNSQSSFVEETRQYSSQVVESTSLSDEESSSDTPVADSSLATKNENDNLPGTSRSSKSLRSAEDHNASDENIGGQVEEQTLASTNQDINDHDGDHGNRTSSTSKPASVLDRIAMWNQ